MNNLQRALLSKLVLRRWPTHSLPRAIPKEAPRMSMPSRLQSSLSTNENTLHSSSYNDQSTTTTEVSQSLPLHKSLLHKKVSVRRTFAPNSNAQAMLVCGGHTLAAHASFDPEYSRAKGYIQNHPVGPAVLSPILISGLVGALIESTLPQSFFVSGSMEQWRPLIVGVEVEASVKVVAVESCNGITSSSGGGGGGAGAVGTPPTGGGSDSRNERYHGHELLLDTEVKRVSDGAIISSGTQKVWLPNYGH